MNKIVTTLAAFAMMVAAGGLTLGPPAEARARAREQDPYWIRDFEHVTFARAYGQFEPRSVDRDALTVGFEFEGHVKPPAATVGDDQLARKQFGTALFPLIEKSFGPGLGSLSWDGDEQIRAGGLPFMAFTSDDSIGAPEGRVDLEINAPVLTRATYQRPLRAFLRGLDHRDFKFTRTSGFHAHVGYPKGDVSSGELILLNDLLHLLQHELFAAFRPHPEREGHILPIGSARQINPPIESRPGSDLIQNAIFGPPAQVAARLGLADHVAAVDFKYALRTHGTIEVRLINASYDRGPDELVYATELVAGLIWAIRTHEPKLKHYLVSTIPSEVHLARINEILGITPPRSPGLVARVKSCWAELVRRP